MTNPYEKRLHEIQIEINQHNKRIQQLKKEQNTILTQTNKETQYPPL